MISRTTLAEVVAGLSGSIAVKTMCADMAMTSSFIAMKGRKSLLASSSNVSLTTGRLWWESTKVRPWPGICFITGSMPPDFRPSAIARPIAVTLSGSCP
ncbi:hypothetical protein D3C71_1944560 [compost metagenome]